LSISEESLETDGWEEMITKYALLFSDMPLGLESEVSDHLREGWQLYGQLTIGYARDRKPIHYQAMIKENEDTPC